MGRSQTVFAVYALLAASSCHPFDRAIIPLLFTNEPLTPGDLCKQTNPLGRGRIVFQRWLQSRALGLVPARQNGSPSPWGPHNAKRSSLLGKLTGGGLGKPLGRGEGDRDI